MVYDEEFIVIRYKEAADKREQIKILAQLNMCSPEKIVTVLESKGFAVPDIAVSPRAKQNSFGRGKRWTKSEEALISQLRFQGMPFVQIAKILSRSEKAVIARYYMTLNRKKKSEQSEDTY